MAEILRVAIYGSDGSGKTTILNQLRQRFEDEGWVVLHRHWRPYLLSKPKKITDITNPHSVKRAGLLKSCLKACFYLADFWSGRFSERKLKKTIDAKGVVLFHERHSLDVLFDESRFGLRLPSWYGPVHAFFSPRMHLDVGFLGDPEQLYARKPETSPEAITEQCALIRSQLEGMKTGVLLDTVENSASEVSDKLYDIILDLPSGSAR